MKSIFQSARVYFASTLVSGWPKEMGLGCLSLQCWRKASVEESCGTPTVGERGDPRGPLLFRGRLGRRTESVGSLGTSGKKKKGMQGHESNLVLSWGRPSRGGPEPVGVCHRAEWTALALCPPWPPGPEVSLLPPASLPLLCRGPLAFSGNQKLKISSCHQTLGLGESVEQESCGQWVWTRPEMKGMRARGTETLQLVMQINLPTRSLTSSLCSMTFCGWGYLILSNVAVPARDRACGKK